MNNREARLQQFPTTRELYALKRSAFEGVKGPSMLKTNFWKKAAASLPSPVRARHLSQLEQAERWELALERAIELWTRVKSALSHSAPRGAH